MRWRVILPICGLLLFAWISYHSFQNYYSLNHVQGRYFWWGALRLDTDQQRPKTPPQPIQPCDDHQGCAQWEPEYAWISMSWQEKVLVLTGMPAFLVGGILFYVLGRAGINQVWTFMIATPVLLAGWYYLLGWLIDRAADRKRRLPSDLECRP